MIVLAGDVGGTSARLALYDLDPASGASRQRVRREYASREFAGLEDVLAAFREETASDEAAGDTGFEAAGFGVAGPLVDGAVRTTNLPWVVTLEGLRAALTPARVVLVNDFHAAALGLTTLDPGRLAPIGGGTARPRGPLALLGAGTGLGEAILQFVGDRYEVVPSEGGHKDFAPRDEEEIALLRWLLQRHHHVSYEHVVSGPGLVMLHEFYRDELGVVESAAGRAALGASADAGPTISRLGLEGTDPVSVRALDRFCRVYGAEAGNLALQAVATGGVFLAGGVTPNILPALRAGPFRAAFEAKGRYRSLLSGIPVQVVLDEDLGLHGAAVAAGRLRPSGR